MSEAVLTQLSSDHAAKFSRPARTRRSLAVKFAVALVGLVTLVLLINGSASLWLNYEDAKRAALGVQIEKAQAAAEKVDGFLSDVENQIGWTTRAEWRHVPVEQQRYDLIRLLRQAPAVTEVSYLDSAGKEQLKVSRLEPDVVGSAKDFSNEPKFKEAVANLVWFGPVYFQRGSEPYMTVAIAHAGRNPGVTVAEVNLKLVYDVVTAIKIGQAGYAFVVTSSGRLIAHPDLSLVLRNTDLSQVPQVARALPSKANVPDAEKLNRVASEVVTDATGRSVLSAHATIGRVGWLVFVQSQVSEALAPVYRSLIQTAALLGLGLLLAAVAGTFLSRRMVVPIRRLQHGAELLGGGDLSQRIAINTGDEIETLADRFNQMAGRIQEGYETLESKVIERTSELHESLQQQTATADVLKVISRSRGELKEIFESILTNATRICDANFGNLFLHEEGGFRCASFHNLPPALAESFADAQVILPPSSEPLGRLASTHRIVHIADVRQEPDYLAGFKPVLELVELGGARSVLLVPMLKGEELLGVVAIFRQTVRLFTDKQIQILTNFASQAVIAIENARLLSELRQSLQRQTATADVLKVISRSTFDLQTVLETLIKSAVDLSGANRGAIFLRDGDSFPLKAASSATPEFLQYWASHPPKAGRGSATERVIQSGKIEIIPDVQADPEIRMPSASLVRIRATLGVPLLRDDRVEGVLVLTRPEPGPFTQDQIDLVQTFGDQAVIAVENVRLFDEIQTRSRELAASLDDLRTAQDRLVQTEKLASLGQLTAGIAHEIKNPLNFVNNFSALSTELIDELNDVLKPAALDYKLREEIDELTHMLKGNLDKVVQHGKRADSIVKNMLLHSREGSGEHRPTDINAIVEESINLAYHGARAEKPNFNVTLRRNLAPDAGMIDLYPQEITRVFLNLITNGFYATAQRKETGEVGFQPTLSASTKNVGNKVEIRIRDNGTGIPHHVKKKMFNPFFTTKPAGEGTGLGLSMSHDIIVKQHGGAIDVDTEPGQFTEFIITLPRNSAAKAIFGGEQ